MAAVVVSPSGCPVSVYPNDVAWVQGETDDVSYGDGEPPCEDAGVNDPGFNSA